MTDTASSTIQFDGLRRALQAVRRGERLTAARAAELAETLRSPLVENLALKPLLVHILRTSTLEPIADYLAVEAAATGLAVEISFGGYGRPQAQLAATHTALQSAGAVVLAFELADLVPDAANDPLGPENWASTAAEELLALAAAARQHTGAKLLVLLPTLMGSLPGGFGGALQPDGAGRRLDAFRAEAWRRLREEIPDCAVLDTESLCREEGMANLLDPRGWSMFRLPWAAAGLRALAALLARGLGALVLPRRKCLVLDGDNTLWGGVLGELGASGIELSPEGRGYGRHALQRDALALARRGVLLAIASKNDDAQVMDVLAHHPHVLLRPGVIAARSIGWHDKAAGLRTIAADLEFGLDALVFVDDKPEECELIRQALPEVAVYELPPERERLPGFLPSLREFDAFAILDADRQRTRDYQARTERRMAVKHAAGHGAFAAANAVGMGHYLASLELRAVCAPARGAALERVAQMEARTNQFNTMTPRLSRTQLEGVITGGGEVLAMSVVDRFGDFGLTVAATISVANGTARIESFVLSCRVIGLGAEMAMLAAIGEWAKGRGAETLTGGIVETERNAPARDIYRLAGFERTSDERGASEWSLDISRSSLRWPGWIAREGMA